MIPEDFLNENGEWGCIRCGSCCMDVRLILPHLASSAGICKNLMLDEVNEEVFCRIYQNRPDVCRFKKEGPDQPTDRQLANICAQLYNKRFAEN